jgi:hypothetical protein
MTWGLLLLTAIEMVPSKDAIPQSKVELKTILPDIPNFYPTDLK